MNGTQGATEQLDRELSARLDDLYALPGTSAVIKLAPAQIMKALRSTKRDTAAQTYQRVMKTLWGEDRPERTNPDWWRTPLGLEMARVGAHAGSGTMTYQEAAHVLQVSRTGLGAEATRGRIAKSPAGGLLVSAVLARLTTQQERKSA